MHESGFCAYMQPDRNVVECYLRREVQGRIAIEAWCIWGLRPHLRHACRNYGRQFVFRDSDVSCEDVP